MIDNFKKPLIPAVLIIVLFSLYFTRWDTETKTPSAPTQFVYKVDRWTGQRWVVEYRNNNVLEKPIISNDIIITYSNDVKLRPAIKEKRDSMIQSLQNNLSNASHAQNNHFINRASSKLSLDGFNDFLNKSSTNSISTSAAYVLKDDIQEGRVDYNGLDSKWKIALEKIGFTPSSEDLNTFKDRALKEKINTIDIEIDRLSLTTANTELGNKEWSKRKYLAWTWDGLMALSVLWLLATLITKKKITGAA